MNIETAGIGTLSIILVMALVTLATRWGGVFVMTFIPISNSVKRFIDGMSGSVLIALLSPIVLNGDNGARIALATTAIIMMVSKRTLSAISAGILVAALVRQL